MTASNDFDRLVTSWLETDGPTDVRTDVVERALGSARGLRQRRGVRAWLAGPGGWPVYSRRPSLQEVSPALRLGIVVALTLALIVGAVIAGSRLLQDPDRITSLTHYDGTFKSVGRTYGDSEDGPRSVAVLLDGRVLALTTTGSAVDDVWAPTRIEAWDPSTGTLRDLGSTLKPRAGATAIALLDGRVLVIGGGPAPPSSEEGYEGPVTAEVFDPATGTSTSIGPMPGANPGFAAAMLPDGRILLAGGESAADGSPQTELSTAGIYDPTTSSWTTVEPMTRGAAGLATTHLADGRLLLVQPEAWTRDGATANIESFDPATGAFSSVGELAQPPATAGVLLADGRVLFAHGTCFIHFPPDHPGGASAGIEPVSTEIFDPADRSLTMGPALPHCVDTATALPDGTVLITGVWGEGGPWQRRSSDSFHMPDRTNVSWAGLLDPRSGSVRVVDAPKRSGAIPIVLANGDVLFVGGSSSANGGNWNPPAFSWGQIFR